MTDTKTLLSDDAITDMWAECSDNDDSVNIHALARKVEAAAIAAYTAALAQSGEQG